MLHGCGPPMAMVLHIAPLLSLLLLLLLLAPALAAAPPPPPAPPQKQSAAAATSSRAVRSGGEQQRQQRDGVMTVASPPAHTNSNKRHSGDTSAVFPLYEPLPPVSVSFSTSDTALQVRVHGTLARWKEEATSCLAGMGVIPARFC
jgi:hypothetical protein